MATDLCTMTVQALSEGLSARRLSPVDVVDAHLARIAALDPKLHAFVQVHHAEARWRPRRPTRRSGPAMVSVLCTAFPLRERSG
jgi:Asp-tRNA(Asn)/Glu-tRNA(Gln) amidotransferase A subunit family amidase